MVLAPEQLLLYGLLVVAGVAAGFINTVAGGGSLLTLPALMLLGLPAQVANGSNRLAVLTQSISGVAAYRRAGKLETAAIGPVVLPTVVGAAVGALVAAYAPTWILEPVLLGTMVVMAIVLLVRPKLVSPADDEPAITVRERPAAALGLFAAGVYGGFIQAGVGFVLLAVIGGLLRHDVVRANALKLTCTLLFGIVALGIFVNAGQVAWVPATVLAVGTVIGSQLGVRFAVKTSPRVLRWIVFIAVTVSVIALLVR